MTEHDQKEIIKCPHCKKDIPIGLDIEIDYDENGPNASARIMIDNEVDKNG